MYRVEMYARVRRACRVGGDEHPRGLAGVRVGPLNPASQVPLVGASGAISGVIAAYILIWPRANIRVFYWFFIFIGTISVPAFVVLGLWFVEQIIALPAAMKAQGGIAMAPRLMSSAIL